MYSKIYHVRSPRDGAKRTCQSPALIKAKHYTRTSEPVGRRHATAGHIVEGAVAECILFRRRDLGCLILSGILEAIERFGFRLRIRVLPIGHIESPLSSVLIGLTRRGNLTVSNRRKITEATTFKKYGRWRISGK